ncbi:MAG TPA: type II secretion system protein GspG [Patescibacteria group bacterium]|nr:type II secretion system protein GspG [Patescibacteria group bacterium]
MTTPSYKRNKGFTLIEILFSISIIGLFSAIALLSVYNSLKAAKVKKVQAELRNIQKAMEVLNTDVGKWVLGCPYMSRIYAPNQGGSQEIYLDNDWAGLGVKPPLGNPPAYDVSNNPPLLEGNVSLHTGGCGWTQKDLDAWRGPYMHVPKDPWGSSYYFDSDLYISGTVLDQAIMSFGPDKLKGGTDDIILYMTDETKNQNMK